MSKYKKQFVVVTEKWLADNNITEVLDIRESANPDFDDKLNRTYAHIKYNKEEGIMVFDWNDKFEIRSRNYYKLNNK